jgi:hypothetical protein
VRASESDRAVKCPGSLVQPRFDRRVQKTEEAADWGTLAHYWKETGLIESPFPHPLRKWQGKDIETLDTKILLSGVRREDYWPTSSGEHEVSFAIRLEDGKLELYRGPRERAEQWKAKWHRLKYATGTIDWIDWGADDRWPSIDDLKTGHWPVDPAESLQHRTYGLVPWLAAGRPSKFWVGLTTTKWERYPLDGLPIRTPTHWSSALELECHLADLLYAVKNTDEVNPEPISVGKWDPNEPLSVCAFCPCRPEYPGLDLIANFRYRAAQHCWPGLIKRVASQD